MSTNKKIGLFGFGTVGQGFYETLKRNPQLPVEINKVCVKRVDIPRINHALYFTDNQEELLEDPTIDIIIEVIDDAVAAKEIVRRSLQLGKHVISANKKMIGESLYEIDAWHSEFESSFLYEAAVGGGIPIIHQMDGFYRNQEVQSIRGILNGSSNYILTQMQNNNWSFERALAEAQKKGFAESNPTLDVDGFDASSKLSILSYHAFGEVMSMKSCELESIAKISEVDIKKARNQGKKIKPVAQITKNKEGLISCFVRPEKVGPNDELFSVDFERNIISVDTLISGNHSSIGKGAGALPTGSAVLEDLKRALNGYKYSVGSFKKLVA